MSIEIKINGETHDIKSYMTSGRNMVTIGRKSEEAYNCITIDVMDIYQCQIVEREGRWTVENGQWRTECPKGLRSERQHACSMCMGRCVNIRTANPRYSWRRPERATLLNGSRIGDKGMELNDGDILTIEGSDTRLEVRIKRE